MGVPDYTKLAAALYIVSFDLAASSLANPYVKYLTTNRIILLAIRSSLTWANQLSTFRLQHLISFLHYIAYLPWKLAI